MKYIGDNDFSAVCCALTMFISKTKKLFAQEAKIFQYLNDSLSDEVLSNLTDNFKNSIDDFETIDSIISNRKFERRFFDGKHFWGDFYD